MERCYHSFSKKSHATKGLLPEPFSQFILWFEEYAKVAKNDIHAVCLSTVGENNRPSARIVLMRDFSENGIVFFTNYQSRKGLEISSNPYAAMTFYWAESGRQLRVEGRLEKLDDVASDKYFDSRPTGSRISAIISPQSKVIDNRSELEREFNKLMEQSSSSDIRRPAFWGGYILKADYFEFWQEKEHRLHDRIAYKLRSDSKDWVRYRLAP